MEEVDLQGYSSFTEYLDDLIDVHEMQSCLEETFGVDSATSKKAMNEWAKKVAKRYED